MRWTVLSGAVADQAALRGLLNEVRDLKRRLSAMEQEPGDQSSAPLLDDGAVEKSNVKERTLMRIRAILSPCPRVGLVVAPLLAVGLLCALALRWQPALAAPAGGTVGTGTPASCTEAALDAAMAGGGSVSFNCGPNPYTITLSSALLITKSTSVDGGGKITLSGNGTVGVMVASDVPLTLTNFTLADGQNIVGGCLLYFGLPTTTLTTVGVVMRDCHALGLAFGAGGALAVYGGNLSISNTQVLNNRADHIGGGIYINGGTHTLDHVSVIGNRANITDTDSGGGLFVENNAKVTLLNSQVGSNLVGFRGYGGGMAVLTSTLQMTNVSLAGNQGGTNGFSFGGSGGGLYLQAATANLNAVVLKDNGQVGYGGAIYSQDSKLTIANSSISNNSSGGSGGGLYTYLGTLTLSHVSVSGNTVGPVFGNTYGGGFDLVFTTASLDNSTIADNRVGGDGGGIFINNGTTLTLNNSTLSGNQAGPMFGVGGGIINYSTAVLNNVTLSGNSAAFGGGIADNGLGATLTLNNSTLSGNQALGPNGLGGGISNGVSTAMLNNVTLSGNSAGYRGGAFYNFDATAMFTNVTLSGNSAITSGGGIYNQATARLLNVTLSSNAALQGGALFMLSGSTTVLTNTILAYSPAGGNCDGTITASKFTFSSDNSCALTGLIKSQDPNGLDPLLDALGNYGGPTLVHMIKAASPAKDGVVGNDAPSTDQRGLPRPGPDGSYDIGAVERQPGDLDTVPKLWLPLIVR